MLYIQSWRITQGLEVQTYPRGLPIEIVGNDEMPDLVTTHCEQSVRTLYIVLTTLLKRRNNLKRT